MIIFMVSPAKTEVKYSKKFAAEYLSFGSNLKPQRRLNSAQRTFQTGKSAVEPGREIFRAVFFAEGDCFSALGGANLSKFAEHRGEL